MKKVITAVLNYIPPIYSKRSFDKDFVVEHQTKLLTDCRHTENTISAIFRVKNAASTLELAVASIVPIATEIILVDNNSEDNTLELMRKIQLRLSGLINVKVAEYRNSIAVYGPHYAARVKNSPASSIAKYYDFAYSLATSDYLLKVDSGCIFFPDAIKILKDKVRANVPVIRFRGMEVYGQLMPYEPSLVSKNEFCGFVDGQEYETVVLKSPFKKYSPSGFLLRPAFVQIKRISSIYKLMGPVKNSFDSSGPSGLNESACNIGSFS